MPVALTTFLLLCSSAPLLLCSSAPLLLCSSAPLLLCSSCSSCSSSPNFPFCPLSPFYPFSSSTRTEPLGDNGLGGFVLRCKVEGAAAGAAGGIALPLPQDHAIKPRLLPKGLKGGLVEPGLAALHRPSTCPTSLAARPAPRLGSGVGHASVAEFGKQDRTSGALVEAFDRVPVGRPFLEQRLQRWVAPFGQGKYACTPMQSSASQKETIS